jgi:hypothetical protein
MKNQVAGCIGNPGRALPNHVVVGEGWKLLNESGQVAAEEHCEFIADRHSVSVSHRRYRTQLNTFSSCPPLWVRDIEVETYPARRVSEVVLPTVIDWAAAESDDGICATDGPEHAGLFEAGTNHALATGFDDTGADKQVLASDFGVSHAFGVALKVSSLESERCRQ